MKTTRSLKNNKPTGRSYTSVDAMMKGEKFSPKVKKFYAAIAPKVKRSATKMKRTAKIARRSIKRDLTPLINAGRKCANCCYNLAQLDKLDPDNRRSMKDSAAKWDAALANLPDWLR